MHAIRNPFTPSAARRFKRSSFKCRLSEIVYLRMNSVFRWDVLPRQNRPSVGRKAPPHLDTSDERKLNTETASQVQQARSVNTQNLERSRSFIWISQLVYFWKRWLHFTFKKKNSIWNIKSRVPVTSHHGWWRVKERKKTCEYVFYRVPEEAWRKEKHGKNIVHFCEISQNYICFFPPRFLSMFSPSTFLPHAFFIHVFLHVFFPATFFLHVPVTSHHVQYGHV